MTKFMAKFMGRNTAIVALLALASMLSHSYALADGTFRLSTQGRFGFSLLNLKEADGMREGVLDGTNAMMVRDPDLLTIQVGRETETLKVEQQGNNTYYSGIWHRGVTHITSAPEKDGFYISGEVDNAQFKISVNTKKGNIFMYWPVQEGVEFQLSLDKTTAQEVGSCKGNIVAATDGGLEEVAKVFCHSSGAMNDALFTNPDDILAWLVYLNVFPLEDDGGGGGGFPLALRFR